MRYGNPSIADVLRALLADGRESSLRFALFTRTTRCRATRRGGEGNRRDQGPVPDLDVEFLQPFYKDPDYIEALWESARPYIEKGDF